MVRRQTEEASEVPGGRDPVAVIEIEDQTRRPHRAGASRSGASALASRLFQDVCYGSPPPDGGAFRSSVLWDQAGCDVVRDILSASEPCLVARMGTSELACVSFYARWRSGRAVRLPYPEALRRIMRVNAGVFPVDDSALDRYSDVLLHAVAQADVMGVWFNRNEHRIIGRYCPDARLVHLEALDPVLYADPWSAVLAGRTVLVVHPFAKTIASQYRTKRSLLFANEKTLPEFELKTMTAVQSGAGRDCGFETWFDGLESMSDEIARTEFDVAIIGAGAYGLPLGAVVKGLGRQAVHLGGATQLLFGVRGRRWEVESSDVIALLFNEHWVRPSAEETPEGSDLVEGGCYW
jgi:hypothetical protein